MDEALIAELAALIEQQVERAVQPLLERISALEAAAVSTPPTPVVMKPTINVATPPAPPSKPHSAKFTFTLDNRGLITGGRIDPEV